MGNMVSNIVRGILGRLAGSNKTGNANSIPWAKEKFIKHQDDTSVKSITLGNFVVAYKRPYELLHTYSEIFGNEIYRFTAADASPLIIDCGSNIGMSVLYFKQLYPDASIIAFEPDQSNFALLKKNIEVNKLQHIELNQSAVWTKNGTIFFEASESEASRISNSRDNAREVKSERLADLLSRQKKVDFLKIDIEGAEWEVIKDCAAFLTVVQHMFLEYHGKTNDTQRLNELLQIVRDKGFSVYIQNAADNLRHPFVNKTTSTPFDVQLNLYCYKTN